MWLLRVALAERLLTAVDVAPDGSLHSHSLVESNLRVVSLVDRPAQFGALVEHTLAKLEKPGSLTEQEQTAQRAVLAFGALLEHLRAHKRAPEGLDWFAEDDKTWTVTPGRELAMENRKTPPPEFNVYMDDPPEKRWEPLKPHLLAVKQKWHRKNSTLVDVIMDELGLPIDLTLGEVAGELGGPLAETVAGAAGLSKMTGRDLVEFLSQRIGCYSFSPFCKEMMQELEGMAAMVGETAEGLQALNLAYELTSGCTTVIAEGEDGMPRHARSMDFAGHRVLRDLTVMVNFYENRQQKKPFASEVKLAGTAGTLSGVGRGFSLSVNQRMTAGWFVSSWLSSVTGGMPLMYAVRKALMDCSDFECAAQYVQGVQLVAPVYLGVAGTKSGEGAIFLRDRASSSCVGLANLNAEYGCTTGPDKWVVAVANDDGVSERASDADPQEFGRRAMAVEAVKTGAFTANNRAGAENMLRALRWAFVSRHATIYRCHATPATGTMVAEVQDDSGGVPLDTYDLIKTFAHFEDVKDACPRWDEWQTCARSWQARRQQLAAQYVGKQGGHPVQMEDVLSCPCAQDMGRPWDEAAGVRNVTA